MRTLISIMMLTAVALFALGCRRGDPAKVTDEDAGIATSILWLLAAIDAGAAFVIFIVWSICK